MNFTNLQLRMRGRQNVLTCALISALLILLPTMTFGDEDSSWWDLVETGEDLLLALNTVKSLQKTGASFQYICMILIACLALTIMVVLFCEPCCEAWNSKENRKNRILIKALMLASTSGD